LPKREGGSEGKAYWGAHRRSQNGASECAQKNLTGPPQKDHPKEEDFRRKGPDQGTLKKNPRRERVPKRGKSPEGRGGARGIYLRKKYKSRGVLRRKENLVEGEESVLESREHPPQEFKPFPGKGRVNVRPGKGGPLSKKGKEDDGQGRGKKSPTNLKKGHFRKKGTP